MIRFVKSLTAWTGVWFLSAFLFTYLVTHRHFGRSVEPVPEFDWGAVECPRLATCDGEDLGAWFVDVSSGNQPAIVLLHGVGDCRRQMVPIAAEFHRRGCPVLMVTQRAHGDSSGSYNDFGCSGGPDVAAAVDWLRERTPGRKIIVWGTSMGAATALFGCEQVGTKVAGYILECPYQNIQIATRNRTRMVLPPGVEALAYHTLNLVGPLAVPNLDRIAPEDAAEKMPAGIPVLILAGERDTLALPEESEAIAARIRPSAKVVIAPGGFHTNLLGTHPDLIRGEIDRFLERIR